MAFLVCDMHLFDVSTEVQFHYGYELIMCMKNSVDLDQLASSIVS